MYAHSHRLVHIQYSDLPLTCLNTLDTFEVAEVYYSSTQRTFLQPVVKEKPMYFAHTHWL